MNYPAISQMMEAGLQDLVFPGAVLLCARAHEILFHEAFGVANLTDQRPLAKDAIFDLASLTKPLATTLAMAHLVKTGRVSLETCLGDMIQTLAPTPKAAISMEMLLRHTSGLPAHREFFRAIVPGQKKTSPRQLLRCLMVSEPLESEPGEKQLYSDLGFMFLSWVIETLSGQRLDQFVRENIYRPLGIEDLFFIDLETRGERYIQDRLVSTQTCPWRNRTLTGEVDDDNAWAAGGIEGHAGLFGDAPSVHATCCEILNALNHRETRLIDPGVLNSFVQKKKGHVMVAGFDTPSKFGSSSGRFFSQASVGHLGFTGTSFWLDPDSQFIVILLTNRVHPSRANQKIKKFRPQIHDLVSKVFG